MMKAQNIEPMYLVSCPTCADPLVTEGGMKIPAHLVKVSVPKKEVDYWLSKGLDIIYEPY